MMARLWCLKNNNHPLADGHLCGDIFSSAEEIFSRRAGCNKSILLPLITIPLHGFSCINFEKYFNKLYKSQSLLSFFKPNAMKQILLTIAFAIPSLLLFSQQNSLLKNFKYRINTFRSISLGANGGGNYTRTQPVVGPNNYSSGNGSITASYYTARSTDKILLTTSTYLNTSFSTTRENDPASRYTRKYFEVSPGIYALNKWFSGNRFVELGTTVSGNINISKDRSSNDPAASKYDRNAYSIAVYTGIGTGRLENITDMQNALWLYKALEAAGSLSRALTAEEQNDLGRAITRANNTRVLDSRKRTQFVLTTVDEYLQQRGLISKTDINYFSNLNDILFFAYNIPRLSGTEKFIRLTPTISAINDDHALNNVINKTETRYHDKSILVSAGFNVQKPASLIHQNNYGASLKFSYFSYDNNLIEYTSNVISSEQKLSSIVKKAGANLFFQHAIYPNTRTILNASFQSETGYQDLRYDKQFYTSNDLNVSVNYFISYRTSFNFSMGVQYQKNSHYHYQAYPYSEYIPERTNLYANAGILVNL